jgi:alpha-tubulin suppressor-like RCC1 family protein
VSGLAGVVALSAGRNHTCAALGDGTVRCWGRNSAGQLGDGTTVDRAAPTVVMGLSDVVDVSSSIGEHTCARLRDGTVRCWGSNTLGQLGDGTRINRTSPTTVDRLNDVAGISTGRWHTCAWLVDNAGVYCWGYNFFGQLGDGTETERLTPQLVWEL